MSKRPRILGASCAGGSGMPDDDKPMWEHIMTNFKTRSTSYTLWIIYFDDLVGLSEHASREEAEVAAANEMVPFANEVGYSYKIAKKITFNARKD